MTRFVVVTLGSTGDLHPFLAIARALRERGDVVELWSQEPYRSEVEAQGVVFHAVVSAHDHFRTATHPDLWHPVRGFGVLWRHLAVRSLQAIVDRLTGLVQQDDDLHVIASPLAVGVRLASEVVQFKFTTLHTAPSGLRSVRNPMFVGGLRMPAWFTDAGRSLIWHGLDRFKLQPMAAPLIDDWLSRNGQPTLNAPVFGGWLNSDQQILALFPADFAPVHTDWPVSMKTVGFPLYESALSTASDPELDAFCRRDTLAGALWVVYCGPTSAEQSDLIHARLRRELGTTDRLLWLGQTSPANHSRQRRILVRQSVSLRRVLPFADVFVHHGGIGSCAQGLTAGIKQRIYPFAYDQFDNAWRVAANLKEHPVHRREPPPPEMYSLPNRPNTSVMQALNEMDSLVRPA